MPLYGMKKQLRLNGAQHYLTEFGRLPDSVTPIW